MLFSLIQDQYRGRGLVIVSQTYLVDEMVTGRNLARLARGVDVLLADGAVRPAQVLDALQS